ncbi:aspartic peptidase domain-containing protein [Fennellomyces sp. T-0311]|nr:aspartic peptidase domain-containing protein [Fennellomyces sp. T-0311]
MLLSAVGLALVAVTSTVAAAIQPITLSLMQNPHRFQGAQNRPFYMEKRHFLSENSSIATIGVERLYNYRTAYLIEVGVGTPAQKFNLVLDTGSPSLWVPSTDCNPVECTAGRFDVSASTSARDMGVPLQSKYAMGAANGNYFQETITLTNLTVFNQTIGLVNETFGIIPTVPHEDSFDGVIGFSFPATRLAERYDLDIPLVFNLANNQLIPEPIFSVYLNSLFEHGYSGEIMLGGIDESKFTGSLTYAPVVNYTITDKETGQLFEEYLLWTLAGTGIKTSTGFNLDFARGEGFTLDTGSTFSIAPRNVTEQIVESITGIDANQLYNETYGLYQIDCGLASSEVTIEFTIATALESKSSNPLHLPVSLREMLIPADAPTPEEASECMFGITPAEQLEDSETRYILGDTFLRSFYTVYDMARRQVGIAPAVFIQSSIESSGN